MRRAAEPIGLYFHIPFCEAKCTYCHFAIDPRRPDAAREERYLRALEAEMVSLEPTPADTLYLGGGTPSLLSPENLAHLLEGARHRFALDPSAEVTLEANPRDLELRGYEAARDAGVNRLSLGVQSFDDAVLKEMGRLHTGTDARRAVELARRAGFENISLDLILGWPGENRARWKKSLEAALSLEPGHLSLYLLELEGKTLLSHKARLGTLSLPDEDGVAEMYLESVEILGEAGLERYEISNFARPGRESRHNGKYWDDLPFLGLGMSAHSYRPPTRWWNVATFGGYCRGVEERGGGGARGGERSLSDAQRVGEALFTALRRREGVSLERFSERYGVEPLREYAEPLRAPFEARLLEVVGGHLRLTPRGVLLSNEVFQVFV